MTRAKMLVAAPPIPARGCISVAEGVPPRGPNPRQGIHREESQVTLEVPPHGCGLPRPKATGRVVD